MSTKLRGGGGAVSEGQAAMHETLGGRVSAEAALLRAHGCHSYTRVTGAQTTSAHAYLIVLTYLYILLFMNSCWSVFAKTNKVLVVFVTTDHSQAAGIPGVSSPADTSE
jgi:hypothetical protein